MSGRSSRQWAHHGIAISRRWFISGQSSRHTAPSRVPCRDEHPDVPLMYVPHVEMNIPTCPSSCPCPDSHHGTPSHYVHHVGVNIPAWHPIVAHVGVVITTQHLCLSILTWFRVWVHIAVLLFVVSSTSSVCRSIFLRRFATTMVPENASTPKLQRLSPLLRSFREYVHHQSPRLCSWPPCRSLVASFIALPASTTPSA